MGLYRYRCRVPGGGWTAWYDWSTTPLVELLNKPASTSGRPRQEKLDVPEVTLTRLVDFDYDRPITPPPRHWGNMSPEEVQAAVDEAVAENWREQEKMDA